MDTEPKKELEKKELEKKESEPYSFSDEATKNKIKRHINDIKDVITEEDIANVKIPGEEEPAVQPEEEKEEDKEEKKDKDKVNPGEGKPITPWDVID